VSETDILRLPEVGTSDAARPDHPDFAKQSSTRDYHSLLAQAVSKLPNNTIEARGELYERGRTVLATHLRGQNSHLSPSQIASEKLAFEAAILRVEEDAPKGIVSL
jgi:hypothetical protein